MKTKLNELFAEKRAVSPVIGVVLMIAVVVILAAVVAAFATGIFGGQTTAPQAAFSYDAATDTVTMASGESIDTDQLSVEGPATLDDGGDGTMDAGDVATGAADENGDGSIDVVWTSADGSDSAVLTSFEVDGGTGGTN